jgi:uncharacterized membrane protein
MKKMNKMKFDPAVATLIAALALGAAARLWNLTAHSLFIDEGFTFMVAGRAWPDMMHQIVYHDFHPPLFYIATHFAMQSLHWDFWNYRYLTAPFGLLTIVATWAIARRLFGDIAAGVAAVLVAVEPSLIEWDRLYRMYSLMTALAASSWWLLLVAQEKKGRPAVFFWSLYAAVSILQPYVQYLGALNVFCQGLYALACVSRERDRLRVLWPVFASGLLALLALAPWVPSLLIQYPNGGHVAGTAELPIFWQGIVGDAVLSGTPVSWAAQFWFDWAVTAAAILIALFASVRASRTILPWWFAVAALQVALSLATHKSLVVPRYLEHVVPALAISVGALVAWLLRTRVRAAALVIGFAVPAAFIVCAANVLWDPFYQQPDWYLINLVVLQHERKSDAMLFTKVFRISWSATSRRFEATRWRVRRCRAISRIRLAGYGAIRTHGSGISRISISTPTRRRRSKPTWTLTGRSRTSTARLPSGRRTVRPPAMS